MRTYKKIPPLVLEKIYAMYREGYSFRAMSDIVGLSQSYLKYRVTFAQIKRNKVHIKVSKKLGKYDHLFDEPVAKGRMYKDY